MLIGVSETLRENEILLTGANGFLGKVLLALLVDRYPQLKHLHVLLRPGNGLSAAERFWDNTLTSPPLEPIVARIGKSSLMSRITVWPGDISMPRCGLSGEAVDRLAGPVGLIINCAGKVDFLPPVDDSFRSNVDGVENVVALARQLGAKLLHVSTSYVCGEADGLVEETEPIAGFYPQRRGPDDRAFDHTQESRHVREVVRQIYDSMPPKAQPGNSHRSREFVQRLIAVGRQRAASWGWANTYTYTKSIGEQIIASAEGLNWSIVRPAIVESAWSFPFPGWIEGGRTSAPLVLMALDGLKDWPVREDAPLEVVPVDMAASAIIIVAALLLQGLQEPVYQLGSADINPVDLGWIVRLLHREAARRASNGRGILSRVLTNWLAGRRVTESARFISLEEAHEQQEKLRQTVARSERWAGGARKVLAKSRLPGEGWLESWATELRKLDLQARFREQTLDQYLPFVLQNRYVFESENIRMANWILPARDRELLLWAPEKIDWERYWISNQIAGIEKWVQPESVREWQFRM